MITATVVVVVIAAVSFVWLIIIIVSGMALGFSTRFGDNGLAFVAVASFPAWADRRGDRFWKDNTYRFAIWRSLCDGVCLVTAWRTLNSNSDEFNGGGFSRNTSKVTRSSGDSSIVSVTKGT